METENTNTLEFEASRKHITIFKAKSANLPIIYLNTFKEEGVRTYDALQNIEHNPFTLVTITELNWNDDMTPWSVASIFKDDEPYTGEADGYLRLLTDEIVPKAEEYIGGKVPWRGLAGYSLAGLFALYSMYRTSVFSRIASISGSLWYPDFKEYVLNSKIIKIPDCIYLSLGDRECRSSNPYLRKVQDNTEEIAAFYQSSRINTVFHLNKGNHYKDSDKRTAVGIAEILK